jgi:hypothetical protein
VGHFVKVLIWFVKTDMAVVADPQELQVDSAKVDDKSVVTGTLGIGILCKPVGDARVLRLYVNMAKQIFFM